MEMGIGKRNGLQPNKTFVNRRSMLSTLRKGQRQHGNNRRKQKRRTRSYFIAKTREWRY